MVGPCIVNMEEDDGRFCSSDGVDLVDSRSAEGLVDSAEVCMDLEDVEHGDANGMFPDGAEKLLQEGDVAYLLRTGVSRPGLDICAGQGSDVLRRSYPSGGVAGNLRGVHARLGLEGEVVLGDGRPGVPAVDSCSRGVRDLASEGFPSLGEKGAAQNASTSLPRPSRMAWSRPAVIPLPVVGKSVEACDGGDRVRLELEEVDATVKLFEFALVGRLFGKRIPFAFLNVELHRRWQGFGAFRIITISNDCFICIFENLESRNAVLMGGPWIVAGHVLGIDCWSPGFSPSSKIGLCTPVWVHLPGLPLYCWGGKSLARIAGGLGEPVWMDAATDRIERGLYARVCIRVDLSRALKPGIWVDGPYGSFFQPVEYEGLSSFCFMCGLVGHKALNCRQGSDRAKGPVVDKERDSPVKGDEPAGGGEVGGANGEHEEPGKEDGVLPESKELCKEGGEADVEKGFGPWMLVQRRKRPNLDPKRGKAMVSGKLAGSNVQGRKWVGGDNQGGHATGKASSSGWAPWGRPPGRDGWVVKKDVGSGVSSARPFGEAQVDLGKVGLKPFSGFKARSEVASLGPILDEDRRKRKKSSVDGGDASPLFTQ